MRFASLAVLAASAVLLLGNSAIAEVSANNWSITVDTSGGISGAGFGSVNISSDGTIKAGNKSGKLNKLELAALKAAVAVATPDQWKDSYKGMLIDGYTYNMTLSHGDGDEQEAAMVKWGDGAIGVPADLEFLISSVRRPWSRIRNATLDDSKLKEKLKSAFGTVFAAGQLAGGTDIFSFATDEAKGGDAQMIMSLRNSASSGGTVVLLKSSNGEVNNVQRLDTTGLETVSSVTSVDMKVEKESLDVIAQGTVRSGGWSNPTLLPVIYIVPPADGIYEYTFVAQKPTGPSTQQISPIETPALKIPRSKSLLGIKVASATNDYIVRITQTSSEIAPIGDDDVRLLAASVADNTLTIKSQYTGGVERHDFQLSWSGAYLESNPPVAIMNLTHKANGDSGEAIISESLHFGLPSLDPCIIRVTGPGDQKFDVRYKLPN